MAGRVGTIALVLLAAIGVLLLFTSYSPAKATTYKMNYSMKLGCKGADQVQGTLDDSCTGPGTAAGQANGPGTTADMTVVLEVPVATPGVAYRSNYQNIYSYHAPTEWIVARDDQAAFGTYEAVVISGSTLSLLNAACPDTPNVTVTIPLYNCSTDNSAQNTIPWIGDGTNLLAVNADGLPEGCVHYPAHVAALTNNARPRSRLMGEVTVVPGAVPTQLEFVVYNPGQVVQLGAGLPFSGMIDTLGYSNDVILDNPSIAPSPGATPNTVTEFCAPMLSNTTVFGKSQGKGTMIPAVGGSETTIQCYDGLDSDGDGVADDGCWEVLPGGTLPDQRCATSASNPLCGIPSNKNPLAPAATVFNGVLGTGSHLVGVYSESWRDQDGDGYPNIDDGCPYVAGPADEAPPGTPTIRGLDGCVAWVTTVAVPPAVAGPCAVGNNDCDNDGLMNRQDTCPFVADAEFGAQCGANNVDNDQDGIVNDGCPQVGAAPETGAQCTNNTDDDGDGAINDGCPANLSTDADKDNIGVLCDTNDSVPDGPYLNVAVRASVCVAQPDADADGWCDSTEALLGSCSVGPCPGGVAPIDSTPENSKIDIALSAAANPPGRAAGTCADLVYYDTVAPFGGAPVDNDGDTVVNAADTAGCDASWPAGPCGSGATLDTDCDGVLDVGPPKDNCPTVPNPEQLNTDAKVGTTLDPSPAALQGDACDADDDQDGATDVVEWNAGTDPKDPCNTPYPTFDVTGGTPGVPDGTINTLDIITITKLLNKKCRVPSVTQVQ